jgi:hypothetical protein
MLKEDKENPVVYVYKHENGDHKEFVPSVATRIAPELKKDGYIHIMSVYSCDLLQNLLGRNQILAKLLEKALSKNKKKNKD